jgi:isopentenyl diphosphate isomerase/L-lactate dehydrogenase-like FMN-dependent dehydrogenase
MACTTVTIALDADKFEQTLDRLTAKAEHLRSLLAEINEHGNDLDAEVELAEGIVKHQMPRLTYAVNMGDIMQLANAPAAVFTPEFLAQLQNDLPKMVVAAPVKAPIDAKKSGDYKKSAILKPFEA